MAQRKPKDCPLFLHRNGQWCRKVRGRFVYFGTDLAKALERWADEKDALLAGRKPKRHDSRPTLSELANVFVAERERKVSAGELASRSVADDIRTLERLIRIVGRDCQLADLEPLDWASVRDKLADPTERKAEIRGGLKGQSVERRSALTVAGDVRRIKTFVRWAIDSELIPSVRFGRSFSPASARLLRKERLEKGPRLLEAAQIWAILEHATPHLRPLIFLGINGALGVSDLAEWRLDQLPSLEGSKEVWIDLPRRKTWTPRRFVLWPETVDEIRAYLGFRKARESTAELLFLTRTRQPWLREVKGTRRDAAGHGFIAARKKAGFERGSFYDLRRTFRTVADEALDDRACDVVMGHTARSSDMGARYTQAVSDDRIRRVCEHVRAWFLAGRPK